MAETDEIVLDTDVLIEMARGSKIGQASLEAIERGGQSVGTTSINIHEFSYGMRKAGKQFRPPDIPVSSFSNEDAVLASKIELDLERSGTPIPRLDAMISSVCITNRGQLYTFDKHFERAVRFGLRLYSGPRRR